MRYFVERTTCECQACMYKRWWNRQKVRKKYGMKLQPRPSVQRDFDEGPCPCRQCLKDRLRAAHRRNKEYLKIIAELKAKL